MTDPVSDYASWMKVLETQKAVHQAELDRAKAEEAEAKRKEDAIKGAALRSTLLMLGLDVGELLTGVYTAPDGVQFYLSSDGERDLIVLPIPSGQLTNRVPLVLFNGFTEAGRAARLMEAIEAARLELIRRNPPR